MGSRRYDEWVEGYVRAWNSNDPKDIGALFTDDARYYTEPYVTTPWTGRESIIAGWIEQKDEPGDTEFSYEVLVDSDELGIVKGRTLYHSTGYEYVNLWEIRLGDQGLCREFVEWWMKIKT